MFKKSVLPLLLVTLLCISCDTKKIQSAEVFNIQEIDSVFALIALGRDIGLNSKERSEYLKKAWAQADTIENDSLKTKVFSSLSLAYLRLPDSLKFRKTSRETRELAMKSNDSTVLAEAHWDLAEFYKKESIADSSYYHFSQAKNLYEALDRENELGTMLNNMAVVQEGIKDYTGSEITTIQAVEVLKPLENYVQLFHSYNNLGAVSANLKEYERSLEYYQEALAYQKKIPFENNLDLYIKNNIGVVYQNQGQYKESLPYFQEILDAPFLLEKKPKLYALALSNLAYSTSKINQNRDMSGQFERALEIQDSIVDIPGISRTHYSLSEYYLANTDTIRAMNHAEKAMNFAKMANNNERILETLQLLTKIDPQSSSAYNQRYITLNDSLQEEERQIRNKFARIRFETDEYIARNEVLASEKRFWAGIAFAIFLLGVSGYVMFDQRAKNQKLRFQQAQQTANQEIFNLMLAQKEKEEEGKKSEQKRISEELHDGVLGRMMGSRMVLTGLNKKSDSDAEVQRQKAIDALQDVEKEIRAISHELSHAAYQKMHNFMVSLRDMLHTVQSASNINCQLVYDDEKEWDALKGDIKINVYRMVQECLQNSVKHAQCKNATVTLASKEGILRVTIADDGKGFRNGRRKKGIGMRNIASRVKKLKGNWHIDSAPGKGTTVVLQIPIANTKKSLSRSVGNPRPVHEKV